MKKWSIVLAVLFATSLFVHVVTAADDNDGEQPRVRRGRGQNVEGRPKRGENREGRPKRGEGEGREGRPKRGEGEEGGRRPPRPMGGMMLMRAIDVNHNGELSAEEIKGAGAAILKALDKNGDKKISKEELMPRRREGEGGRRPPRRGAGEGQQGRKRPPRRGGGEGEEGVRRLRRGGEGREAGERKRPEAEE